MARFSKRRRLIRRFQKQQFLEIVADVREDTASREPDIIHLPDRSNKGTPDGNLGYRSPNMGMGYSARIHFSSMGSRAENIKTMFDALTMADRGKERLTDKQMQSKYRVRDTELYDTDLADHVRSKTVYTLKADAKGYHVFKDSQWHRTFKTRAKAQAYINRLAAR